MILSRILSTNSFVVPFLFKLLKGLHIVSTQLNIPSFLGGPSSVQIPKEDRGRVSSWPLKIHIIEEYQIDSRKLPVFYLYAFCVPVILHFSGTAIFEGRSQPNYNHIRVYKKTNTPAHNSIKPTISVAVRIVKYLGGFIE